MNNKNIKWLLDENTHSIYNSEVVRTKSSENGVISESSLTKNKEVFFNNSMRHLLNELIDTKRNYPTKGTANVNLELDCVVMKRDTFNKIKKYING